MSTIGPIVTVREQWYPNHWGRTLYYRQEKYRSKPRNQRDPLPYRLEKATSRIVASAGPLLGSGRDCLNRGPGPYLESSAVKSALRRCEQKAYGKLIDKVKTLEQGWGETLATRKQAYSMMLHRISTLTTAARRLRRGDIPGFCRALGTTERRSRTRLKKAADTWLEYHFGWEPLLGDIYTACKISQADFPVGRTRAKAEEEVVTSLRAGNNYDANVGRVSVLLQGDYTVENPDKYLLNQLGIINPVGLAWELVPFSFVVDWFVPIGQFFGSLTDFYGIKREREFTTRFVTVNSTWGVYYRSDLWQDCAGIGIKEERTLGVNAPKPTFKLYRGFSPARGATAIALLVGMLKSLG